MPEWVVSGCASGLGKAIKDEFEAVAIDRDLLQHNRHSFDSCEVLIHCAFERYVASASESEYIDRSLELAEKILEIEADRYVFISSIECDAEHISTPYARAKLEVEALFSSKNNHLNLRLPSLYGKGMIRNQVLAIATEFKPALSLREDSTFSLVAYRDVTELLKLFGKSGTLSLVSDIVTLSDIASRFNSQPVWGDFLYQTPQSSTNQVIVNLGESLNLYEKFVIDEFGFKK